MTPAEIEAAYQKDCERSSLGQVVGWATWQVHAERFRDDARQARAELAEVRRRTALRCAEIALRRAAYLEGRQKSLENEGMPEMAHDAWAGAVGANLVADDISGEFALAEQPPQPQAQQQACGSPPAQDAGERHGKGKP
jgi:hypothetical protein